MGREPAFVNSVYLSDQVDRKLCRHISVSFSASIMSSDSVQ